MTGLKIFALWTLKYFLKNFPAACTQLSHLTLTVKEHIAEKYLKSPGTLNSISV